MTVPAAEERFEKIIAAAGIATAYVVLSEDEKRYRFPLRRIPRKCRVPLPEAVRMRILQKYAYSRGDQRPPEDVFGKLYAGST